MPDTGTVVELFELAIEAERTAEALYRGLETKFAHQQEVADFWKRYAAEEAGHARWLGRLRDRVSPGQLAAPADPVMLRNARQALRLSVEHALKEVKDLEDAYQLTNELESAEMNTVFEFLITSFPADEQTPSFLRDQLKSHVDKITIEFLKQFQSTVARRALKALE